MHKLYITHKILHKKNRLPDYEQNINNKCYVYNNSSKYTNHT